MEIKTVKQLEKVIKLLKREKVDIFELNGLKIVITKHPTEMPEAPKQEHKSRQQREDEILFYHENL